MEVAPYVIEEKEQDALCRRCGEPWLEKDVWCSKCGAARSYDR